MQEQLSFWKFSDGSVWTSSVQIQQFLHDQWSIFRKDIPRSINTGWQNVMLPAIYAVVRQSKKTITEIGDPDIWPDVIAHDLPMRGQKTWISLIPRNAVSQMIKTIARQTQMPFAPKNHKWHTITLPSKKKSSASVEQTTALINTPTTEALPLSKSKALDLTTSTSPSQNTVKENDIIESESAVIRLQTQDLLSTTPVSEKVDLRETFQKDRKIDPLVILTETRKDYKLWPSIYTKQEAATQKAASDAAKNSSAAFITPIVKKLDVWSVNGNLYTTYGAVNDFIFAQWKQRTDHPFLQQKFVDNVEPHLNDLYHSYSLSAQIHKTLVRHFQEVLNEWDSLAEEYTLLPLSSMDLLCCILSQRTSLQFQFDEKNDVSFVQDLMAVETRPNQSSKDKPTNVPPAMSEKWVPVLSSIEKKLDALTRKIDSMAQTNKSGLSDDEAMLWKTQRELWENQLRDLQIKDVTIPVVTRTSNGQFPNGYPIQEKDRKTP